MPDASAGAGWRHRFENVEFDEPAAQLLVDGRPVVVEPRPLQLLAELLRRAGEVVTKEELLDSVWEGRPTVDHVLANAVSKLRAVLGEAGAARIVTVPRVGYRLLGPVQRIEPAAPGPQAFAAGQPVPGRAGYVLERPLGLGSRSDVWLARHTKLGQAHVFKFADDGARLSALKREYTLYRVLRQELGPRDDFAVVVDSNFVSAPYFLECAYGGLSLLEWSLEDGRLAALGRDERLALFLQIARAVAAAHSVGVLHKDIKPGNVLVAAQDGAPHGWQARLTDFGSGRLLDAGRLAGLQLTALGLTQTREHATPDSRSGTLMYLAPEVLAGQAPTVQNDVYALGLLLYQLLAGDLRRPLATGWERDIDDALLRDDVALATEGQRDRRLAGVAELMARLQSLQQRRAAAAAQQQASARAERDARLLQRARARRPWVLAALVCLALGLGASLYFQAGMQRALQAARASAERAAAINAFLANDLLFMNDALREGGDRPMTVLEQARQAVQKLPATFKGQPQAEAEVRHQLGRAFERMSSFPEASLQYDAAMRLLATVAPADDPELLTLRLESTLVHQLMNEADFAEREFAPADAVLQRQPPAAGSAIAFLYLRAQVGMALQRKQPGPALALARSLVALAERQPAAGDAAAADRAEAQLQLGMAALAAEDAATWQGVLARLSAPPLAASRAAVVAAARLQVQRAVLAVDAGQHAQAEAALLDGLRRLESARYRSEFHIGYLHQLLASVYREQGRNDEAVGQLQASATAMRQALGSEHSIMFDILVHTALNHIERCDYAAALPPLDELQPFVDRRAGIQTRSRHGTIKALALLGTGRAQAALGVADELLARIDQSQDTRPAVLRHRHATEALKGMALRALAGEAGLPRVNGEAGLPRVNGEAGLPRVNGEAGPPRVSGEAGAPRRSGGAGATGDVAAVQASARAAQAGGGSTEVQPYIEAWLRDPVHRSFCIRPVPRRPA